MARIRSFRTNPVLPPIARAGNLAILILKAAKVSSWAGLAPESMMGFEITEEQRSLLEAHLDTIAYIRVPMDRGGEGITVACCDKCGRFSFLAMSAPVSKKCSLRLGCSGMMFKATSGAARIPKSDD